MGGAGNRKSTARNRCRGRILGGVLGRWIFHSLVSVVLLFPMDALAQGPSVGSAVIPKTDPYPYRSPSPSPAHVPTPSPSIAPHSVRPPTHSVHGSSRPSAAVERSNGPSPTAGAVRSKEVINNGKKAGIAIGSSAVLLQVVVVSYLLAKRRQMLAMVCDYDPPERGWEAFSV